MKDGDPNEPGKPLTITFTAEGFNPNTRASLHIGSFEERTGPEISPNESDVPTSGQRPEIDAEDVGGAVRAE